MQRNERFPNVFRFYKFVFGMLLKQDLMYFEY
jgi:hypothetical protein